jgi:murein DD-endopeptidase MepM/ murein hydrolase activator NlpD
MRIAKNLARTVLLAVMVLSVNAAHAAEAPRCSGGLQLTLSAALSSQGSLILAEVRSPSPIKEVTGTWADRDVYFWKATSASATHRASHSDERQALLGVDLEKAPGIYELSVTSVTATGETSDCTASLMIRAGKFATESLKVDQQFVEPNEQQAARAAVDQQKLRAIFDHVTPEKLWRGPFRMPLDGPAQGTNFGKRRILNGQPRSPHTGADFPAPTGTPIHATQSGRVTLAEELYFSGNTVIIDHGLGIYSLYGHLSAIDVAVGDDIKVGAVLGKVGATGRVTGPHLHWGVTVNKARVNPVQLVTALRIPMQTPRN